MEKDKYYTPSIEEFCIGFEFQRADIKLKDESFEWFDEVYGNGFYIEDSNKIIKRNRLRDVKWMSLIEGTRVKYLDREDIEECGWIFQRKSGPSQFFKLLKSENVNLVYQFDDKLDKSPFINIYFSNGPEFTYDMKIKNKSELKRILNQLGI